MDNIARMDHMDPNINQFINNIINQTKMVELTLHNIYEIKLIDKDTNDVDTYYGVNLMTNWFFKNRYMGDADTASRNCYIMIGDGINASHQPSVDNRAMYHIITNTYKSNDTSQSVQPVEYNSTDRMILQTIKVCKTKYDYNINGYDSDVTINEIGYGNSPTILYSHSKVYDINGTEKTIIKRPNQSLEITLYWKISIPESVFTSLETNGIYGAFSPYILLRDISNSINSKPRIYPYLRNSARTLCGSTNYSDSASYQKAWYSDFGSTSYGGTIVQNDDGSRTWNSSSESYVLETDKFDSFTSVLYRNSCPGYITNIKCAAFYSGICLFRYFKLPAPETIETIVKTTMFYNCNFYNIMGVNYQYRTNNRDYIEDRYAQQYLRGYLPVVDMDIQSVCRYNFSTAAFDVEESFNNPKQNDYDLTGFHCACYQWMKWPDNKSRDSYVCTNQNTTTRLITSFDGTGATCYATDKWWDVSTWELVSNTEAVEQSLQRKKYYIFNKAINLANSTSTLSLSTSNAWIPNPQTQYTNGVHKINEQFERHVDETNALLYANNNSIRYITHANEDYNFYVQNNIVFRRPETQFSICPAQYIFNNVNSIFRDVIPDIRWVFLGNQLITATGKLIYLVKSYATNTQPGYTREAYGINFCITNLALQDDAINSSTKAVSINDKFTHTLKTIDNYVCVTHGKYLLCSGNNELIIYNTDTDDYWLYPYKINKVREIHGTSKIILNPSSDNNRWTIYDCDTKQITHQFDVPSDYAPTKFLAFEDWIYIYATYGSTHAMLLYTISTQELKQIEYPSILDSYGFYGFTQYYNDSTYSANGVSSTNTDYFISDASKYNSCGVQYKDGILCIVSPDYYNSFIIISRYNPEHIINQSTFLSESDYSGVSSALIQLCKIYENYYVGFTVASYSSGYYRSTKFYDIGRIIRNDNAVTSSNESEYQVDYLCFNRDGMNPWYFNVMTAYKNKIYAYGNYFSGCNVEVLPPEGIITHKINFKTNTITRWNNPKKITLPKLSLTLTNIINHN